MKHVYECENCEVEFDQGDEVLIYDDCYFCSTDCVMEHIYEGEKQEIQEVVV